MTRTVPENCATAIDKNVLVTEDILMIPRQQSFIHKWKISIGEVTQRCVELKNQVDNYEVIVFKDSRIEGQLKIGNENLLKNLFYHTANKLGQSLQSNRGYKFLLQVLLNCSLKFLQ